MGGRVFVRCGEDGNESKLKWLRKCRITVTQGGCDAMDSKDKQRNRANGMGNQGKASIYRIKVFSAAYT